MIKTAMLSLLALLLFTPAQQPPRVPDVQAQRQAMKKVQFLVGEWSGEGRMARSSGEWTEFNQIEHAEFKLNGLLLVIEGVGRTKSDMRPLLQAYGVVTFDD